MDDTHRKIELQSSEDLRYLIANVTRLARAQIDTQLPADDTSSGREGMEEAVDAYIKRTFTYALPNLIVNGMEQDTLPEPLFPGTLNGPAEEFEAYDHDLATRVQSLYASLEAETLALAQLRREAPIKAAVALREQMESDMKAEDERWATTLKQEQEEETVVKEEQNHQETSNQDSIFDTLRIERLDQIEKTWGTSLDGLLRLKGTLPSTAAKLERAKAAVEYLESQ